MPKKDRHRVAGVRKGGSRVAIIFKDRVFEDEFYRFCAIEGRPATSSLIYLARLGLEAFKKGEKIPWDRPPEER